MRWDVWDDGEPEDPVDETKPAYRIPSMAEIAGLRGTAGLTCVSTFSGCGGSCLGFEWAGYRPVMALEFVDSAVDSYLANHDAPVIVDDIREVEAEMILARTGLARGELDVLEGSPPCESFSTSGKLSRGWGKQRAYTDGKVQRMDDLFFDFARLLDGLQPRAFVAENVSGLVKGVSKGYFKRIHAALGECGYRVQAQMLDAQWLGVPQRRTRVIFVGVRNDLGLAPAFPVPLRYRYSIRDALAGLATVTIRSTRNVGKGGEDVELDLDQPAPAVQRFGLGDQRPNSVLVEEAPPIGRLVFDNSGYGGARQSGRAEEDLDAPLRTLTNANGAAHHFKVTDAEMVEQGRPLASGLKAAWESLHEGEYGGSLNIPSDTPGTKKYFDLVRPDADEPCPTIHRIAGEGVASVTHPSEPRKFSIAELRRLCGFPDDFVLEGSYPQQWERLGNAVPPPMMFHVAAALRDHVLAAPAAKVA